MYVYHLLLNFYSQIPEQLRRLERQSSKREIVGSNPAVGKNNFIL